MKYLVSGLLAVQSTLSFAGSVKLDIPVVGYFYENNKEVKVDVKEFNAQLKSKGLAGIPEVVSVGKNPERFFNLLNKRIEAAREVLGKEFIFNINDSGYSESYLYRWENLCYRGDITALPELITAMLGNFLAEEQSVLAIGAGKNKVIYDDAFKSRNGLKERFQEEYETNIKEIDMWLNYKASSKTALIMSDYGSQGDGTELEVTLIPACM